MKTMEMASATASLLDYARSLGKEPVVLTVRGKPRAALVSLKNADMETAVLSTHPRFMKLIERSRLRYRTQGGLSLSEMRRRLGLQKDRTRR